MIDTKTIREVYNQASLKQQYYIFDRVMGENLYAISQKYFPTPETDLLFNRTVCQIILGFYRIEDTVPLLQQELGIDPKTAARLGAEVLEFLAPLSDPNWQPPVDEETLIDEQPIEEAGVESETALNYIPVQNESAIPSLQNNIYTEIQPVTPLASDTPSQTSVITEPEIARTPTYVGTPLYNPNQEPVYQSEQPTITRTPIVNVPTYQTPPAPQNPSPTPEIDDRRPKWSTDY